MNDFTWLTRCIALSKLKTSFSLHFLGQYSDHRYAYKAHNNIYSIQQRIGCDRVPIFLSVHGTI